MVLLAAGPGRYEVWVQGEAVYFDVVEGRVDSPPFHETQLEPEKAWVVDNSWNQPNFGNPDCVINRVVKVRVGADAVPDFRSEAFDARLPAIQRRRQGQMGPEPFDPTRDTFLQVNGVWERWTLLLREQEDIIVPEVPPA